MMRCKMYDAQCTMLPVKYKSSLVFRLLQIRHYYPKISLLFVSFLVANFSFSQTVSASLDRDKILLGEQVTVELKAENINTQSFPILAWFSLPDTSHHIEVVKRSPIDTVVVNGSTSYVQNITLTSFDSGDWKLPPLFVILQNSNKKNDTLKANELSLEVLPVDVTDMQEYHPMKDIINVDVQPDYLSVAGIVLLVLLAGIAVWYFFFRKKKEKTVLQPVAARSLFETTIEQLEKLQKENPPAQAFYTRLDEICRAFFQNQLHMRAMQLTSDEMMIQLNVYIQQESRTSFYQLLRLISAVKFAKYQPGEVQKTADINTAKEAVEHIYYHLQRNLAQHAN